MILTIKQTDNKDTVVILNDRRCPLIESFDTSQDASFGPVTKITITFICINKDITYGDGFVEYNLGD
jgi:hypothetical protein